MPVPEGFIMPTMGVAVGGNVLKATPTADVIAGAMGTMCAEVKRHREFNPKRTQELASANLPGEMCDEIELVLIKTDKYTTVPLRASNLTDPTAPFHNELSLDQQIALAELREKFRKNEHGADTPIANWDALNINEQMQLVNMGVMYVEQLASYKEHEVYKLGNGGAELVQRAQRHIAAKRPSKQEDFENQMLALVEERKAEKARADELERRYFEMQERLAAIESTGNEIVKRAPGRPRKPGVQQKES